MSAMPLRRAIESLAVSGCEHPGMAWSYLLASHERTGDTHAYHRHVSQVAARRTNKALYQAAFDNWDAAMTAWPNTLRCHAITLSPTAIGLGSASLVDVGFTLHHTYGVPYLPGSALKGLARRAAADFDLADEQVAVLFGDESTRGYITFWDGWLDPGKTGALTPDVITVHHPQYYASQGATPPTDFDDPNPVAFLSMLPGVRFHIALSAPDAPEWLAHARDILAHGLKTLGIGAKTAVGYGSIDLRAPDAETGLVNDTRLVPE